MSLYRFLAVLFLCLYCFSSPYYALMYTYTRIRKTFLIKKFILCFLYKCSPYICIVQKG